MRRLQQDILAKPQHIVKKKMKPQEKKTRFYAVSGGMAGPKARFQAGWRG
jgi:hypothetical protein